MSEFLFDKEEIKATSKWHDLWQGMPEFSQEDLTPYASLLVHFESESARQEFARLIGQTVTPNTRSVWYPKAEIGRMMNKRFSNAS